MSSTNPDSTPSPCRDYQSSSVNHEHNTERNSVNNSMISNHESDQNVDNEGSHSQRIAQTNERHDEVKHEITQEKEEEEIRNCEDSRCEVQQLAGEIHPANSSGDFGQLVKLKAQRPLTDSEKLSVLENHFVPGKGNQFPSRHLLGSKDGFNKAGSVSIMV